MKILYVSLVDRSFAAYRLSLAKLAREAGFGVIVVTRVTGEERKIEEEGMRVIPVEFDRSSLSAWRAIRTIRKLVQIYRKERPDLVHHIAMKPVLFGSIAARWSALPAVVNLIGGRGWIFTSEHLSARLIRPFVKAAFRVFLRPGHLIVQNRDDAALMQSLGLNNVSIVPGSGVDTDRFMPSPALSQTPIVVLVGRLLWDKGVGDFVEAARILRRDSVSARFVLVGVSDPESRTRVPESRLRAWAAEGAVELWGASNDIPAIYARADIACLPSYSEGIPKALLEAASCGLPLVTTDVPGCRDMVIEGENGFIVPVRRPDRLAAALRRLIETPALRQEMGRRSRELILEKFTAQQVHARTLAIYDRVLASSG